MTSRDWDARSYDRVSDHMTGWGRAILDRLPLDGHERVLDAGCGTGRVTEALRARLPVGQVVALDARRLESAGFVDVHTWLHEEPTQLEPGEPLEEFLATVALRSHLQHLAPGERPGFVRAVAQRLPRPEIDYVRLNILARRAR